MDIVLKMCRVPTGQMLAAGAATCPRTPTLPLVMEAFPHQPAAFPPAMEGTLTSIRVGRRMCMRDRREGVPAGIAHSACMLE